MGWSVEKGSDARFNEDVGSGVLSQSEPLKEPSFISSNIELFDFETLPNSVGERDSGISQSSDNDSDESIGNDDDSEESDSTDEELTEKELTDEGDSVGDRNDLVISQSDEDLPATVGGDEGQDVFHDCQGDVQEENLRRSSRTRRPPQSIWNSQWNTINQANLVAEGEMPRSVKDAMKRSDWPKWKEAAEREVESMKKHEVWDLTPLPSGKKAIGCRWVFTIKENTDGSVNRYKARLVAKGFSQVEGVDYDETFAPVVQYTSIKILLSISNDLDLDVHHVDVQTAFLNGSLEEDLYMCQPEGFVVPGKEDMVCKLKKSIYGLKQAPRCWNGTLHGFMVDIGFFNCQDDPCLYVKKTTHCNIFVAIYVDDLLVASNSIEAINEFKLDLNSRFDTNDLGELKYFLGIEVKRDRVKRTMQLGQWKFLNELLVKTAMSYCRPIGTPVEPHPFEIDVVHECDLKIGYRSIVGSLLYLAGISRPDISTAVGYAGRFQENPQAVHWKLLQRILRYLKGSEDICLTFTCGDQVGHLEGFSDADFAEDKLERKSVTGYLFKVGNNPVVWRSVKQKLVTLSSCEAEYVALSQAVQEALWLRRLLEQLGFTQKIPTVIWEDNQSTIHLAKDAKHHGRSKHIDVRYHFVRQYQEDNLVKVRYIPTGENIADMFTKPLSKSVFEKHKHSIGLLEKYMR